MTKLTPFEVIEYERLLTRAAKTDLKSPDKLRLKELHNKRMKQLREEKEEKGNSPRGWWDFVKRPKID